MRRHAKKTALTILGIFFLILGIIGLVLPILQGFLFIALGIIVLSIVSERFARYVESHTRKAPKLHTFVVKVQHRIAKLLREEPPFSLD